MHVYSWLCWSGFMNMIDHFICSLSVRWISSIHWIKMHVTNNLYQCCLTVLVSTDSGWRINECFRLLRARWSPLRITEELNVFLMLSPAYIDQMQVIWLALGGLHMMTHWVAPQQSLMRAALLLLMEGLFGWRFGRSGLRSSCGEKRSRSENVTRLHGSQL